MKILITGSKGFIAKNLILELQHRGYKNLYLFDRLNNIDELDVEIEMQCKEVMK